MLFCSTRSRTHIIDTQGRNNHKQGVTWESGWYIGFKICEAVYSCAEQSCRRSESFTALVVFCSLHSFSGWLTEDDRSQQTFRADKVEGRYGRTAGGDASMELIVEVKVLRVAQTGCVGGKLRRSGRFTKRWWRQHLRRRRSCRRGRQHPRQR